MDKKKRKITQKKARQFSEIERHAIIKEMLKNNWTKQYTWKLYTGKDDHGCLLRWMRQLGYVKEVEQKNLKFRRKIKNMGKKASAESVNENSFELLQLKKRIADLEKQLSDAEMKSIAYSTMIELAEKEYNISIKKNFNTQLSQK